MPVGIASYVLQCKPDISKQKGYFINLEADNFKKKLYYAIDADSQNDLGCLSGGLYTDADNILEYSTTKLILTLANHKDSNILIDPASEAQVLMYQNRGYIKPLNNWNNLDFFTIAFPTLFFFQNK